MDSQANSNADDARLVRVNLPPGSENLSRRGLRTGRPLTSVAEFEHGRPPPESQSATRKPREYLLESIVYPNKQIADGFENVIVSTKNGTVYAGLLKQENETEMKLNSPDSRPNLGGFPLPARQRRSHQSNNLCPPKSQTVAASAMYGP